MARLARRLCLVTVLALASACGGGGGGTSAAGAINSICQKALSCGEIPPDGMEECVAYVGMVQDFIANPARTVSCVQGLSCLEMEDYDYVVETCIAYDTSQFACQSETVLQVCNIYDECRDVDCEESCDRLYSTVGDCGEAGAGYPQCRCYL